MRATLWIGTSGFQYPEWKGIFYPKELPLARMLPYYAEKFSATEINYSFRRIPSRKTIENWAGLTPDRFKFSFKAPQKVTHFARLQDCAEILRAFHESISPLGEKLGAVLFQLPPNFKKDVPRLGNFLGEVPSGLPAAFEFRHPSWFDDEVFDCLRRHNTALCVAESESLETPWVVTADFGFLRLRREDYGEVSLKSWAEKVLAEKSWREIFIFFKHEETGIGPKFGQQFQQLTNA